MPSHSPTLSVAPSRSLDYCISDQFGVEKIYASGEYSSQDWYANWEPQRTLSGYQDPFDVDEVDERTQVLNNGLVGKSPASSLYFVVREHKFTSNKFF